MQHPTRNVRVSRKTRPLINYSWLRLAPTTLWTKTWSWWLCSTGSGPSASSAFRMKISRYWKIIPALMKKKRKFSSYKRKFRMEQLQSHIWLTASSYMGKYLRISSYIRKPFLIYDFATAPFWISLYMTKILYSFYQCVALRIHSFEHSTDSKRLYLVRRDNKRKRPKLCLLSSFWLQTILPIYHTSFLTSHS